MTTWLEHGTHQRLAEILICGLHFRTNLCAQRNIAQQRRRLTRQYDRDIVRVENIEAGHCVRGQNTIGDLHGQRDHTHALVVDGQRIRHNNKALRKV